MIEESEIHLRGLVGSVDGRELIRDEIRGPRSEAVALGIELGERVLAAGGKRILDEVYRTQQLPPPEV